MIIKYSNNIFSSINSKLFEFINNTYIMFIFYLNLKKHISDYKYLFLYLRLFYYNQVKTDNISIKYDNALLFNKYITGCNPYSFFKNNASELLFYKSNNASYMIDYISSIGHGIKEYNLDLLIKFQIFINSLPNDTYNEYFNYLKINLVNNDWFGNRIRHITYFDEDYNVFYKKSSFTKIYISNIYSDINLNNIKFFDKNIFKLLLKKISSINGDASKYSYYFLISPKDFNISNIKYNDDSKFLDYNIYTEIIDLFIIEEKYNFLILFYYHLILIYFKNINKSVMDDMYNHYNPSNIFPSNILKYITYFIECNCLNTYEFNNPIDDTNDINNIIAIIHMKCIKIAINNYKINPKYLIQSPLLNINIIKSLFKKHFKRKIAHHNKHKLTNENYKNNVFDIYETFYNSI